MRAYRVRSGRSVAPFLEPPRSLHIATKTLGEWQEEVCRRAGLALVDVDAASEVMERPALVFFDDVFFSEMALRNFLADALATADDVALAMPASAATRATEPASDARALDDGARGFDVFRVTRPAPIEDRAALIARCRPIVQGLRERTFDLKLPRSDRVEAPLTARVVAHVGHWLHVLRLSQLAIGVMLLDRLRHAPRKMLALRLAKGDPWRMARALVFVDPSARVHPKADLEAAIVGPGAVVRAHAHVHGSILGRDVEIGDHAVVMGSTLAERVQVLRASYLAHCAAMSGGTLASYKVQLSLFGRDVFLTSSAWLLDAKLKGEIRVEHEGALVPVGTPFLGCCLGHRAVLGAQATIQSGRAVPNGVTILGPHHQVALDLPAYPEGTILTVRRGRAVPLSEDDGEGPVGGPSVR